MVGQHRSTQRLTPPPIGDEEARLREFLRGFSKRRPRWGWRRAATAARKAGLDVPEGIDAWFATERLRETLLSDAAPPDAALAAAHAALAPALANDDDTDGQMLARLTDLQLTVAELQWRQRKQLPTAAIIQHGVTSYRRLLDSSRDLGDGHCDGGDLLLARAQQNHGATRQRDAHDAVTAFRACIDGSPLAYGYRRPDLDAALALLADDPS